MRTPAFVAALPELRLTVQRRVAGAPPDAAADVAAEAGALAAALQGAALPGLPAAPPERLLRAARRKAAVIAAVLPELQPRLDALLRRLAGALPGGLPLVPAHGDFHADQLLLAPGGTTLVDFDELCRAAPALDLATFAADVVRGRDDDRRRARGGARRAARGVRRAGPPRSTGTSRRRCSGARLTRSSARSPAGRSAPSACSPRRRRAL